MRDERAQNWNDFQMKSSTLQRRRRHSRLQEEHTFSNEMLEGSSQHQKASFVGRDKGRCILEKGALNINYIQLCNQGC